MGSQNATTKKPNERVDKLVQCTEEFGIRLAELQAHVEAYQDALRLSQQETQTWKEAYEQSCAKQITQIENLQLQVNALRDINAAFRVSSPEDAAMVARTLETLGSAHSQHVALRQVVVTLQERTELMQEDLQKVQRHEERAVEQLVSFKTALQQTTTAQMAQEQRVQQARSTGQRAKRLGAHASGARTSGHHRRCGQRSIGAMPAL